MRGLEGLVSGLDEMMINLLFPSAPPRGAHSDDRHAHRPNWSSRPRSSAHSVAGSSSSATMAVTRRAPALETDPGYCSASSRTGYASAASAWPTDSGYGSATSAWPAADSGYGSAASGYGSVAFGSGYSAEEASSGAEMEDALSHSAASASGACPGGAAHSPPMSHLLASRRFAPPEPPRPQRRPPYAASASSSVSTSASNVQAMARARSLRLSEERLTLPPGETLPHRSFRPPDAQPQLSPRLSAQNWLLQREDEEEDDLQT